MPAHDLIAETFPFLKSDDINSLLQICEKNKTLFYFPEEREILGFYRFFPELIYAVAEQDYGVLMKCDLTEGPLVYVAALITQSRGLRMVSAIVRTLNARAYAFHRYKKDEWEFHFVRNNRYATAQAGLNHESQQ